MQGILMNFVVLFGALLFAFYIFILFFVSKMKKYLKFPYKCKKICAKQVQK